MPSNGKPTSAEDVHVLGEQTTYEVVQGSHLDTRDWLANEPYCPSLNHHHIAHVGIMRAEAPFQITRHNQSGTFMLSCFQGSGLILVDGSWHRISEGEACLLPPFVMNSLRCEASTPWHFSWVRYLETPEVNPIVSAHSPVSATFAPGPLRRAIQGLRAESVANSNPAVMQLWVDLVQAYVNRFAQPYQSDSRLYRVWSAVEQQPGRAWSLAELAATAAVSEEHLRRLCKKELGRSPMQQVTFLRMQKASHLLATTDEKIETIAREVGYRNPFTFSTTFKKWVGWRPSEHRGHANQA
ncbi:MAG: AraC family transcriptional regulator [Akkermansiaceae bacterium]|nr:AraC family transcriptional regulator [Akkermansiaceae bacterium]NNM31359.1 AraC family transcriptional regulator [Akkermansiaceae bacterium]